MTNAETSRSDERNDQPDVGAVHDSKLLITWVWIVTITGAIVGFGNALYTTFGDALPSTLGGLTPALPMLMLPVAELGLVPITSAIFHKKLLVRCLAVIGMAALTYPAVENWAIGFDRIAQMRVRTIVALDNTVARAKADEAAADREYTETIRLTDAKRTELRNSIAIRDQNIAAINAQLKAAVDAHQGNLDQIRAACRIVRERCTVPRSQTEDQRYATEVSEQRRALAAAQKEREEYVRQIDQLVKDDAADAAKLEGEKRRLTAIVDEAEKQAREGRSDNVIYRLAASYFRTQVGDLTASQIGFARWVFAVVPAVVIGMAGTLGAVIHYSPNRTPGAPSFIGGQIAKLMRARRAYLARMRKSIPVSDKSMSDFMRLANVIGDDAKPNATDQPAGEAANAESKANTDRIINSTIRKAA